MCEAPKGPAERDRDRPSQFGEAPLALSPLHPFVGETGIFVFPPAEMRERLPIFFNIVMLPTAISSYFDSVSANTSYMPVQVRVESIELRHIPEDAVSKETLLKEVFYVPDLYIDLWVASGDVTILEKDGITIEPVRGRALFTVPKRHRATTRKHYIQHYKMDATIDSERFEIGKLYRGWVLRNGTGEVFFSRASDRMLRVIWICIAILLIPALYLTARFIARLAH